MAELWEIRWFELSRSFSEYWASWWIQKTTGPRDGSRTLSLEVGCIKLYMKFWKHTKGQKNFLEFWKIMEGFQNFRDLVEATARIGQYHKSTRLGPIDFSEKNFKYLVPAVEECWEILCALDFFFYYWKVPLIWAMYLVVLTKSSQQLFLDSLKLRILNSWFLQV